MPSGEGLPADGPAETYLVACFGCRQSFDPMTLAAAVRAIFERAS